MPWFIQKLFRSRKPDVAVREQVESDDVRRCPKLSALTMPLEHYITLYEQSFKLQDLLPRKVQPEDPDHAWYVRQVEILYHNRVVATWGLIAKGSASIPYALQMLKSRCADVREDGAGVLMAAGQQPGVIEGLLAALGQETETQSRDAIILALGKMKDKRAIPAFARIIRQPDADEDTRWSAIESLGRVVHRTFTNETDAVEATINWLNANGY